jgi:IS1 family transposase
MRKLNTEQRAAILAALVEGNSIASTCRMLKVNKITVLRLLVDAGQLATDYQELMIRDISPKRVQVDEQWAFIGKKAVNVRFNDFGKQYGDAWAWISLDPDTKLVINWHVGGRDSTAACAFVADLADRLTDRTQLTSDGLGIYRDAINRAFGTDVDYGQIIKEYKSAPQNQGQVRYSPAVCVSCQRQSKIGNPDPAKISTSHVERLNLTNRMSIRRFTRLTNAFSKRFENHCAAVALHYFHYNFIRRHMTIKTTPAIMAGVADHEWTMLEFVQLMEKEERILKGRLSDYKPSRESRD